MKQRKSYIKQLSLYYSHKKRDYIEIERRQGQPFHIPEMDDEKDKEKNLKGRCCNG
jgi:hypothetical protein